MRALLSSKYRFFLAWMLPVGIAMAAWRSPGTAWLALLGFQAVLVLLEMVPSLRHSAPAALDAPPFRLALHGHVLLQALLFGVALVVAGRDHGDTGQTVAAVVALGIAVGGVTGGQGITFAHELGHSRRRIDRLLAWCLMSSVGYAHFMIEHYRGHHPRAATSLDPATAREGESLWQFLPRTLAGSLESAWALERERLHRLHRPWSASPLAWATAAQAAGLTALAAAFGWPAALFWLVQAAYAVFLLETVNYIEHYGLQRRLVLGRPEPFGIEHAWNADHAVTNCFIANLQRHSDHHMRAWKRYPELEALTGPQLPTGYTGCLFLALVPRLWFDVMHPRLRQWHASGA